MVSEHSNECVCECVVRNGKAVEGGSVCISVFPTISVIAALFYLCIIRILYKFFSLKHKEFHG